MPELDFDRIFSGLSMGSNGNTINDIFDRMPTLTHEQMLVLDAMSIFIEKYDLQDLKAYVKEYKHNMRENKALGLIKNQTFKSFLKAYSLEEQLRGVKISNNNVNDNT